MKVLKFEELNKKELFLLTFLGLLSSFGLHACDLIFDPELEKTARRTRKETRQLREEHSSATSQRPESEIEPTDSFGDISSDSEQEQIPMANARTLRELAAPDLNQQPLCITFPTLNDNTPFELKSGLIHLLPSFHGLPGEEPYKHLQEFDVVCNSMKPPDITEEQIKMRAFPFSLKDSAKDWLYYLPPGSITTWNQLKKKFLDKYFSASRAASLRKEICEIKQHPGESLYEYWEWFKKLCRMCPQHQISEQLLMQYFYEGLLFRDRSIIDAASGGALVNKTSQEARELIERMAENSQQFNSREDVPIRKVNEVETYSMQQQQLTELTSFVRQLAVGNASQARVCGICTGMGHSADMCPMLQEETAEQVNMAGHAPAPRKQYDPYSSTYNLGWRDHPNLSYGGNRQPNFAPNRQSNFVPNKLKKSKKQDKEKEILEVFRKRLRGDERVIVGENVSAVLQRKLPPKCGDPGMFTIPCRIGNTVIRRAMLDLGASINVMPKSIYASLKLDPLKETEIIIQLADRTNAYPDGLVEDVLVKVNDLVFPSDFYVLDMDNDHSPVGVGTGRVPAPNVKWLTRP
ncbi:uncharacterized protein [Coffea arabica]|uniref:Retrotransposon gag domain-containing protein n=1 Tax=Coffea arabica TaxID=13443 RepID=A0ABM4VEK9_COFAR